MGGTDAAQPIDWAGKNKKEIDVFIVFTDCQTYPGQRSPAVALREYRQASGIKDARSVD